MRPLWWIGGLALAAATGCGGGSSSSANNVQQTSQITVTVSPSKATVPIDTLQPFDVFVLGTSASSVKWTVSAGTIDQSGNYTAPSAVPPGGSATVTATVNTTPSVSGSATVTITTQPVTLDITPSNAKVKAGFSVDYVARVGGTTNIGVDWSVADFPGDLTFPGFMSGGWYRASAPVLMPDTFSILAVSSADPTKTASATVNVVPLENQEQQSFPIKLGASGVNANAGCCSGTLGSLLVDQKGKQYILSNNHVMGRSGHAAKGEAIVHPGYVDTLCNFSLPKTVANFTHSPRSSNVDAAIAEVVPGAVDSHGEIIGLGGIASDGSYIPAAPASTTVAATVGMPVAKSGRTTGLDCGTVFAVNATILVDYKAECGNPVEVTLPFSGQVVLGSILQPGDSGSLLVEAATSRPAALLFAASDDGQYSFGNPTAGVLAALETSTGSTFNFVGGAEHSVSCAGPSPAGFRQNTATKSIFIPAEEITHAVDVQRRYENEIMRDAAVRGVAIGDSDVNPGHASLVIFVERGKTPEHVPDILDGVAVRLIKTGRFRADTRSSNPIANSCTRSSGSR